LVKETIYQKRSDAATLVQEIRKWSHLVWMLLFKFWVLGLVLQCPATRENCAILYFPDNSGMNAGQQGSGLSDGVPSPHMLQRPGSAVIALNRSARAR
jgi:hypothetical protein